MEWIVLGSGCAFADPREKLVRNPAGHAAVIKGEILLFDFGFGNLRQLSRAGLDPLAVTDVFISHRHPDHLGDLAALLFYFHDKAAAARRLRVFGPRGFSGFFARLAKAHHPWLKPRYKLDVSELEEGDTVRGAGWTVKAREVPHSTQALAFRLDAGAKSACYTGDTGFDPGLALFARKADLFVLDCTLPDSARDDRHLRVGDAARIFEASQAKRALFSHLSFESARQLSRGIPARAAAASDLMRVKL